jgi:acyl-CoA synthetase (AMP-forming)/AMP-acid ligase II
MYGQTEATARLSYLPPSKLREKIGSIGIPIPNVKLKIVNNKGIEAGYNEEGELIANGLNIMQGYYKDVLETNEVIKNNWLYTGDIAKKDKDGFFYIVGRKKEIIKVGGNRVSPKEIESVILEISQVIDCTIKSVDDDVLGESLKAEIVIDNLNNKEEVKQLILMHCKEKLALYKIPQMFDFSNKFNVKITGKR